MLSFLSNTRVYLAARATDLRKSFDTLAGVVRESLRLDPLSGHLFVFTNSRKNRIKILFWDNTGWWVCAKRLEAGTLAWPASPSPSIELSSEELTLLGWEGWWGTFDFFKKIGVGWSQDPGCCG